MSRSSQSAKTCCVRRFIKCSRLTVSRFFVFISCVCHAVEHRDGMPGSQAETSGIPEVKLAMVLQSESLRQKSQKYFVAKHVVDKYSSDRACLHSFSCSWPSLAMCSSLLRMLRMLSPTWQTIHDSYDVCICSTSTTFAALPPNSDPNRLQPHPCTQRLCYVVLLVSQRF